MNLILHKQKPKPNKEGIKGSLCVHDLPPDGLVAYFLKSEEIICTLKKPDIIFINAHGIMLKGYEPAGCDKQGRQKFAYQEWFCVFLEEQK